MRLRSVKLLLIVLVEFVVRSSGTKSSLSLNVPTVPTSEAVSAHRAAVAAATARPAGPGMPGSLGGKFLASSDVCFKTSTGSRPLSSFEFVSSSRTSAASLLSASVAPSGRGSLGRSNAPRPRLQAKLHQREVPGRFDMEFAASVLRGWPFEELDTDGAGCGAGRGVCPLPFEDEGGSPPAACLCCIFGMYGCTLMAGRLLLPSGRSESTSSAMFPRNPSLSKASLTESRSLSCPASLESVLGWTCTSLTAI
mmetsp:Transcript_48065/g.112322  ORF Transcript_48065/g.112322 Transcript_48065/m.112322 type:complete len:252 (+) Transcript_48065:2901-3656(+)